LLVITLLISLSAVKGCFPGPLIGCQCPRVWIDVLGSQSHGVKLEAGFAVESLLTGN